MNLAVRFFATLKDRVGNSNIKSYIPVSTTVDTMLSFLVKEKPTLQPYLNTILVAVNRELADSEKSLPTEDKILLFTPVSEG